MDKTFTWLRWVLIAGIFAVPFIPFIVSTTLYFPFITGKNFAFRILIDLLFAIFLVLALREPAYRPKFSWVGCAVLALTFVACIATILSVDPVKSFWSNFERMEGLVGLLHLTIWFFMVSVILSTEKLWERFLQVSIGASVIMGMYVVSQVVGVSTIDQGGIRADGTFGNAIYLAVYMMFHLFFTLLLAAKHKGAKWVYALYGIAFVFQLIGLYYAATRSATLGFLGGLIVASLYLVIFERDDKRLRRISIGVLATIAVLVGGFISIKSVPWVVSNPVLTRFASISTDETTVKSRFMIWGMAVKGVEERPVFGWGQENFNFVFNKYYNPGMWGQEQWFDRAHNAFIDWLVAGGILGLLAFIALFLTAAIAFWRAQTVSHAEKAILLGLLAAYAFHSLFVFDNLMSSVYFFVLLALAHSMSKREVPRAMFLTRRMSDGLYTVAAPVAVVAVLIGSYYLNAPGLATASTLIEALTPTKLAVDATGKTTQVQKDPLENLKSFDKATSGSSLGKQEAVEQLLQISSTAATTQGLDPAVKDAYIKLATDRGAQLLIDRPNDARLELFYGSFLDTAGNTTEGTKHLIRAHELSPTKQTIAFELGVNVYLRSGDLTNALSILKAAYDEAPDYPEAAKYYAMALLYAGKQQDADALLNKSFGTTIVDDDRFVSVYSDVKLYDRVIAIWQLRIQKDSTNPQFRASLAAAYKSAGNTAQAVATLQQAIKDFPQYASQLNDVAKQLGVTI